MSQSNTTKEQLKVSAQSELEKYHKALLQVMNRSDIKKKQVIRGLSVGLTQGLISNLKQPMNLAEETIANIVYRMTDCILALKAIKLDEEQNEQEEMNNEQETKES